MTPYWILYFYVTLTTVLCSVNKGAILFPIKPFFFTLLLVILVFFSGLRGGDVDADSLNYINWFNEVGSNSEMDFSLMKDPSFYFISYFLSGLGLSVSYLFLSYSAIAVWSKFYFSKCVPYSKYSHYFLYLYFCRFYFPHEMTQIRAGVAVGFSSLAVVFFTKNKINLSFLFLILAALFHLSVVLIFPFFFLLFIKYDFKSRYPIFLLLILSYIVNLYLNRIFEILGVDGFVRIASYINGEYSIEKISLFSFYFLSKSFLIFWLIFYRWKLLSNFDRLVVYLVVFGISLQIALLNNDALALRLAEVFSIFDLILLIIPFVYLTKYLRAAYYLILIIIGVGFFISSLKIMNPYEFYF